MFNFTIQRQSSNRELDNLNNLISIHQQDIQNNQYQVYAKIQHNGEQFITTISSIDGNFITATIRKPVVKFETNLFNSNFFN